jgi:ribosome biogenesis GTPase
MTSTHEGLVVRARSRSFTLRVYDGEEVPAVVPKKLRFRAPDLVDPVAVGDRVRWTPVREGALVVEVLPRENALFRPASGRIGKRQVLAANLDLAVVVLAAREPVWKPSTLDRYLVLASVGGVAAMVCINKVDLDPAVREAPELEIYPDLGIPVLFVSARTEEGMDELRERLAQGVAVLLGPSGAGKTSLVNRLVPEAELRVGEISERTQKGRHTTTWVEMIPLPSGGSLVDSPGLRVLDLSGLPPEELAGHFPEFRERAQGCRFQDCRHLAEPDCAIKEAVEAGRIAGHRYLSYRRIHESLSAGEG